MFVEKFTAKIYNQIFPMSILLNMPCETFRSTLYVRLETSGVNFTNVLRTAFTLVDPKCARRQSSQQCRLALLGSMGVKAVSRTLMI